MRYFAGKFGLQTSRSADNFVVPSDMTALFLLLIVALTFAVGGCATDPQDKAFFETGWRHPGQNDSRMNQR